MPKLAEKPFADLIAKYLKTLEPTAKNVTVKANAKQVPQDDGGSETVVEEEKGDMYVDEQAAKAFGMSIAKAVQEHVVPYLEGTIIDKLNELVGQYNQLLTDIITAGTIPTTAQPVEEISLT